MVKTSTRLAGLRLVGLAGPRLRRGAGTTSGRPARSRRNDRATQSIPRRQGSA